MKDNIFIDSNIWVYAVSTDNENKRISAINLLKSNQNIFVSTQVLNEFYITLLKYKVNDSKIIVHISDIISNTQVATITIETLKLSWNIKNKYTFSLWDSLIIASAIQNKCSILYSEDMHHNQLIEKTLKICNPFA